MKNAIEILTTKYFPELSNSDYNSKVCYKKNGKTYVACFHACGFRMEITFPLNQLDGHKALKGLKDAILNQYEYRHYN